MLKTQATIKLMSELIKGRKSGEEKGWLSYEDVKAHFEGKDVASLRGVDEG